jgi:hypothetical protein
VLITSQGNPNPSLFDDLVNRLQTWVKRNWRAEEAHVIKGYGLGPNAALEPFLKQAEDLARSMCA